MKIILAGQKSFGRAVLRMAQDEGHEVVQVFAPEGDALALSARLAGLETRSDLTADTVAEGADLIVCAHSHAFVSRKARDRTPLGAIGYHPSLLPRHRGRDAIRWTVHMRDPVAGGSVYWLTERMDGGPIAAVDWCHVRPDDDASSLWSRELFPMGVRLLSKTLSDLDGGLMVRVPQEEAVATWEPSWERPPAFRPDLPRLSAPEVSFAYRVKTHR